MIDLLENILVPGGRARISPYVQDAQLDILFGSVPDPLNRHDSVRGILKNHENELQKLADAYIRFANSGRNFDPATYQTKEFLELYLSYYFTTNLSKIQLCLLDLVRTKKITSTLKVVDIGVGAGTTAVAVLDFMLAWATANLLTGTLFPVESLVIECHDISQVCLDMAKNSVNAFCDAADCRRCPQAIKMPASLIPM
jgi:hypothetical protein